MSTSVLNELVSEEFAVSVGFIAAPATLCRVLSRTEVVRAIRRALQQGAITEDAIRGFVSGLLADFRVGQRFDHELALAALAVTQERRPTDFAEEFLHDLARLRLAEMSLCVRVARECVRRRSTVASHSNRVFELGSRDSGAAFEAYVLPKTRPNGLFSSSSTNLRGVA